MTKTHFLEDITYKMRASEKLKNFMKSKEDEVAFLTGAKTFKSYICPAGKLTIGWGHTGADVRKDQEITREQADEIFNRDLAVFESALNREMNKNNVKLTQGQFDALVDLSYNLGSSRFFKTTLWKKVVNNDMKGAADEFPKLNKARDKNGNLVVLSGLTNRRNEERKMFME